MNTQIGYDIYIQILVFYLYFRSDNKLVLLEASLTQEYEKPEVQNLSDNILSPAKRNYQYIWRNVAQQMPLRETHVASGFKHLDVNKRNYQHIWRNIADRMPKENYLSEITNDYRGPYN